MKQSAKSKIWHCHRIKSGEDGFLEGVEKYLPPSEKWVALRSVSGTSTLAVGGEINNKNLISKLPSSINFFSENDRCYIGLNPPIQPDIMCKTANYRVVCVLSTHSVTEIIFERTV